MEILTITDKHSQTPLATDHAVAKTWVEIDQKAFEHNIRQYKTITKTALLCPVIKSNAYGHGIAAIAMLCEKNSAVDRLCVVSLSEAVYLRSIGIKKPIIVLSIIDAPLEQAVMQDIIVTIYDLSTAHALQNIAQSYNKKAVIHVKVDTGLSRLGVLPAQALSFFTAIAALPGIIIEGMFTHFANSESSDQHFVDYQLTNFDNIRKQLTAAGIMIPVHHTTCSAATSANNATHYSMVRAGIGIYGLWPSDENKKMTIAMHPTFSLKPVLSWKTTIIQIKEIPAGAYIGYDLTYQTQHATRIAILPVGYWDGYDRRFSNNSVVMIHNSLFPIVGRIAMNLMMVDITGINASLGDQVTLLGNYSGITADDLAARCNTINYELVTRINPLLPRIVV